MNEPGEVRIRIHKEGMFNGWLGVIMSSTACGKFRIRVTPNGKQIQALTLSPTDEVYMTLLPEEVEPC